VNLFDVWKYAQKGNNSALPMADTLGSLTDRFRVRFSSSISFLEKLNTIIRTDGIGTPPASPFARYAK
jgi:hypothetical protein